MEVALISCKKYYICLHQTSIFLKLLLQPDELTVASTHAGSLGCECFTVGLRVKNGAKKKKRNDHKHRNLQISPNKMSSYMSSPITYMPTLILVITQSVTYSASSEGKNRLCAAEYVAHKQTMTLFVYVASSSWWRERITAFYTLRQQITASLANISKYRVHVWKGFACFWVLYFTH